MAALALAPDPTVEEKPDPLKPKPPGSLPAVTAPSLGLAPAPTFTPTPPAAGAGNAAGPEQVAFAGPGAIQNSVAGAPSGAVGLAPMTPPGGIPAPTVTGPSAPIDRVKLATDIFNQTAESTAPAYAAAQRDTARNAAALGQVGSGGLRTRTGTLALERGRDLDLLRRDLITKATGDSIADANTAFQQQLAGSQFGLAKEAQATSAGQAQQQIDLARKQQEINAAFDQGKLTLAEKDQKLRELESERQNTLQTGQLALAKEQVANQAAQFGASQKQQLELAKLADKTANRQIDVGTAQGQNALLLELARIMGGPTGNVDPKFIAAIAKALGVVAPVNVNAATPAPPIPAGPEYKPEGAPTTTGTTTKGTVT